MPKYRQYISSTIHEVAGVVPMTLLLIRRPRCPSPDVALCDLSTAAAGVPWPFNQQPATVHIAGTIWERPSSQLCLITVQSINEDQKFSTAIDQPD